jgi:flagellar hook-basal body complex protein FliE
MMAYIEPVTALPAIDAVSALQATATPSTAGTGAGFGTWFASELAAVNGKLVQADRQSQAVAAGAPQNLHETMINLEEARLSFQLLMQVRNKLLEAYQEVMKAQV